MAARKKPQTDPVLDSFSDTKDRGSAALTGQQFGSVVRYIKSCSYDDAVAFFEILKTVGTSLKVVRGSKKLAPVKGMPVGSDQIDIGSIITWGNNLKRSDKDACSQVALLIATIRARVEG